MIILNNERFNPQQSKICFYFLQIIETNNAYHLNITPSNITSSNTLNLNYYTATSYIKNFVRRRSSQNWTSKTKQGTWLRNPIIFYKHQIGLHGPDNSGVSFKIWRWQLIKIRRTSAFLEQIIKNQLNSFSKSVASKLIIDLITLRTIAYIIYGKKRVIKLTSMIA